MSNSRGVQDWPASEEYQDITTHQQDYGDYGSCDASSYSHTPGDQCYTHLAALPGSSSYHPAPQVRSSPDFDGYLSLTGDNDDQSYYRHWEPTVAHHTTESLPAESNTAARDFAISNQAYGSGPDHQFHPFGYDNQTVSQTSVEEGPDEYQDDHPSQFTEEPESIGGHYDEIDDSVHGRDQHSSGHSFSSNEPNQGSVQSDGGDERRDERHGHPYYRQAAIDRLDINMVVSGDRVNRQRVLMSNIDNYDNTISRPESSSSSSKGRNNKERSTQRSSKTTQSSNRPRSGSNEKKIASRSKKHHQRHQQMDNDRTI
ncbi:hypothetical protein SCAR479_08101 [Seiridium cardinale]|uniref:Uncharacterized protein n=1 Tax=Seiridium cardinale TaxID=138064 RepID=A0ABR2XMT7_9PEZI